MYKSDKESLHSKLKPVHTTLYSHNFLDLSYCKSYRIYHCKLNYVSFLHKYIASPTVNDPSTKLNQRKKCILSLFLNFLPYNPSICQRPVNENQAQYGMYFRCLTAALGSESLIFPDSTVSFIILDAIALFASDMPNLSLTVAFETSIALT